MTMSPMPFLLEIDSGGAIPPEKQAYFEERFRNRLYDLVLRAFREQQRKNGLTQKDVADRLAKRPEQINRWLSGPGNWTLDTVTNLLLAICKGELTIGISVLSDQPARNRRQPDWLTAHPSAAASTANDAVATVTSVQSQHPSPNLTFQPGVQVQRADAASGGKILCITIKG